MAWNALNRLNRENLRPSTHMSSSESQVCPLYIGGKWVNPANKSGSPVFNPSRGSVIASVPMCGAAEVDLAVASAKAAGLPLALHVFIPRA